MGYSTRGRKERDAAERLTALLPPVLGHPRIVSEAGVTH